MFKECGGILFLLQCDFEFSKLPIKLSAFHQQVLLYWKLISNIILAHILCLSGITDVFW